MLKILVYASFYQEKNRICPFSAEKSRGRVNPQIQARRAEDVDVVLQAEYSVSI